MSDPVKVPNDGVEDAEVSHEVKSGIVKEEPDKVGNHDHLLDEVGQESFGAPPYGEGEYVNGYPVIRNGNCSPRRHFPATANGSDEVPMSPNSLCLPETMETHH
jgi:hypothetical protein